MTWIDYVVLFLAGAMFQDGLATWAGSIGSPWKSWACCGLIVVIFVLRATA